jgi:hypothetical protein
VPESPYRAPLPVTPPVRSRRWLRVVIGLAVVLSGPLAVSIGLVVRERREANALRAEIEAQIQAQDVILRRLEAENPRLDRDAGRGPGDNPIWIPKAPRR